MLKKIKALSIGILLGIVSLSASAHFVVMYTPQTALLRASDVPMHIVFTHVFAGGPTYDMEMPERFYYTYQQGAFSFPEEVDLKPYLEEIEWHDGDRTLKAWRADIPRDVMRSLGDYQIVIEPEPYWEEEEGLYIQQFSKVMVNVGGVGGNWLQSLGLPAEIQALNKPYANWTGGVFRGVVLSEGLPVPFTQVEVEYMNHPPNLDENMFQEEPLIEAPHPSLEAIIISTNEFGEFSFAMPKAGWWGFAALTVGPERELNGEFLSQDAILWVQATDLPE
ncbi:MAG: nickel transporter [Gammaproteobacteria bacterium]|nr:nickel transporter [Gammaproteobacteria bacterium]MAY01894.1 nickel transporter [Gammaproteobacteria bacterium]